MRKEWPLPAEKSFRNTWSDWLQVLLDTEPENMRAKLLLLLWRCWHLRENTLRHNGRESITSSVIFLRKYTEDLQMAAIPRDGFSTNAGSNPFCSTKQCSKWSGPERDAVKLNTDAAFQAGSGVSATGAVARDSSGHVVVSISRKLPPSRTVEEAEAKAALAELHTLAKYFIGPSNSRGHANFLNIIYVWMRCTSYLY
ncbi:hypothetical protein VPH35_040386 [Triticum aestivum]|uniref:Uncharacterized protein n=1 Tax=Aegilops tauschii TaxID=37682 RepID=R7W5P0_AEGTA